MPPSALEIAARDCPLRHVIAVSPSGLVTGTLNSTAAFSVAACSSGGSTSPSQTALLAIL